MNIREITDAIKNQKYKEIILNDALCKSDFEYRMNAILHAFESILPEKSGFEK